MSPSPLLYTQMAWTEDAVDLLYVSRSEAEVMVGVQLELGPRRLGRRPELLRGAVVAVRASDRWQLHVVDRLAGDKLVFKGSSARALADLCPNPWRTFSNPERDAMCCELSHRLEADPNSAALKLKLREALETAHFLRVAANAQMTLLGCVQLEEEAKRPQCQAYYGRSLTPDAVRQHKEHAYMMLQHLFEMSPLPTMLTRDAAVLKVMMNDQNRANALRWESQGKRTLLKLAQQRPGTSLPGNQLQAAAANVQLPSLHTSPSTSRPNMDVDSNVFGNREERYAGGIPSFGSCPRGAGDPSSRPGRPLPSPGALRPQHLRNGTDADRAWEQDTKPSGPIYGLWQIPPVPCKFAFVNCWMSMVPRPHPK